MLRSQTQTVDIAQKAAELKWALVGYVCRMPNELWAKIITQLKPHNSKRRRSRHRL